MSGSSKRIHVSRVVVPRLLRRFVRNKDGATAVEFAILAVPFLALLFAVMQTALLFFAQQTLETAAADSARLVLTGQMQKVNKDDLKKQGLTELDNFKNEVCKRISALFECGGSGKGGAGLVVDVRSGSSFTSVGSPAMGSENDLQNLRNNPSYQPGGPGEVVAVRLIYEWPLYLDLSNLMNFSQLGNKKRLLVATTVFRNEPFPAVSSSN